MLLTEDLDANREALLRKVSQADPVFKMRSPTVLILGASRDLRYPIWITGARGHYVCAALDENPSAQDVKTAMERYIAKANRLDMMNVSVTDTGTGAYDRYAQALVNDFEQWHAYLGSLPTPPRRLQKFRVTTSSTSLQLELYETDYRYFFERLPRGQHASFDLLLDKSSWVLDADGVLGPYLCSLKKGGAWITDNRIFCSALPNPYLFVNALGFDLQRLQGAGGYGYEENGVNVYDKVEARSRDFLLGACAVYDRIKSVVSMIARGDKFPEGLEDSITDRLDEVIERHLPPLKPHDPLQQNVRKLREFIVELRAAFLRVCVS